MARDQMLVKFKKAAKAQGWRVEPKGSGHLAFLSPDGESMVVVGGTPSDIRSRKNDRSLLRRNGLEV